MPRGMKSNLGDPTGRYTANHDLFDHCTVARTRPTKAVTPCLNGVFTLKLTCESRNEILSIDVLKSFSTTSMFCIIMSQPVEPLFFLRVDPSRPYPGTGGHKRSTIACWHALLILTLGQLIRIHRRPVTKVAGI